MSQDLDQSPAVPYDIVTEGPTIGPVKNYNPNGGGTGTPGGVSGNVQYNQTGAFGGLTDVQLTTKIQLFTSTLPGAAPASGGGTTNYLRADGTWVAAVPLSASVTYSQIQNVSASPRILGNVSGVASQITELTGTQVATVIDLFTSSLRGQVPGSGGGTTNFLRADGVWVSPGSSGAPGGASGQVQFNNAGSFGGVTVIGDATLDTGTGIITIANDAVTYAKMQNIAANNVVLGNISGASQNTAELTGTQVTALLDTFTSSLKGVVPSSGGGTVNFLRSDGAWVPPPGGSGGTPGGALNSIQWNSAGTFAGFAMNGDATLVPSTGVITIANAAVTYAKMQNVSANRILGNNTGGATSPIELTAAQVTAFVNPFTSVLAGTVPASGGGTTNFLRADGTWIAPGGAGAPGGTNGQIQYNNSSAFGGFTVGGDATLNTGSGVLTIANLAVTYAKMQNVAANNRILGNIAGAAQPVTELTGTQATTVLDVFTSTLKGVVPGSGGGTTNFLRADGTWVAPGGAGAPGGVTTNLQYNNAGAFGGMSGTAWDDTNRSLVRTGATITASKPINDDTQTWNNAAVTFTGYRTNFTDTASNINSLLVDHQVGGVSKWKVRKDGTVLSGIWGATAIAAPQGGTGQITYVLGDTLYASSTTALSRLPGNSTATRMFLSQVGNGLTSAAPAWVAAGVVKNQIPNVMDYGAVNTDSAAPADMLATVTAFTNAWAAAGGAGVIYAPAGFYRINANLLGPNQQRGGIIGDGGLGEQTVINSIVSTGDVITNRSSIPIYKGLFILRTLSSGTNVHGVTAATSGAGLNLNVTTNQGYVEDIWSRASNVGIKFVGCGYGIARALLTDFNSGDGFQMIDTSGVNALQWALDTILSENNLGKGYNIDDGNHGVPVECHTNLLSFNNGDVGYNAHGVASIRMNGGFFGNDISHEILLSGVAASQYSHIFTNVAMELAGVDGISSTKTQASGLFMDSTLGCDVCLVNCSAVNCTLSGVIHNATGKNLQVIGGFYNGNGTMTSPTVPGNQEGILVLVGTASVSNIRGFGNIGNDITATAGCSHLTVLGNNARISSAATTTYNPAGANY